ncbi:MAG: hypothetical protein ACLQQ4_09180 [Bacteroidia bacterium]
MKKTTATETENLKDNFYSAAEKTTEMAKSFVENGAKQFEATLNAGKAMLDTITKQYTGKEAAATMPSEFFKDGFESTVNASTKWFKESSKIMTDLFDKQSRFMLNSYSGFMEMANEGISKVKSSELGTGAFHNSVEMFLKNLEESSAVMKKMFANVIDMITDEADKGFVKEISDLMHDTYNKQTEQLLKFNKNLLGAANLQSTIDLNKEISEKLQKDFEKNFEASKKIIKSISDSYTRENGFSTKSGKKMLDEIFAEIDVVTKNNMKFWTNWFDEVYSNNKKAETTGAKATTGKKNGQHVLHNHRP